MNKEFTISSYCTVSLEHFCKEGKEEKSLRDLNIRPLRWGPLYLWSFVIGPLARTYDRLLRERKLRTGRKGRECPRLTPASASRRTPRLALDTCRSDSRKDHVGRRRQSRRRRGRGYRPLPEGNRGTNSSWRVPREGHHPSPNVTKGVTVTQRDPTVRNEKGPATPDREPLVSRTQTHSVLLVDKVMVSTVRLLDDRDGVGCISRGL